MKIELVKEEGKTVGWHIIAENDEDKQTLNSMRHCLFYGKKKTKIVYDGCINSIIEGGVIQLFFATKEYREKKREEYSKSIGHEEGKCRGIRFYK